MLHVRRDLKNTPVLLMQDEENNHCTSTFSDYACEFEKLRQKKILAEQAEMTSRRNESSSSSSRGNVPNPFPTTPISNASFARGRNLSVCELNILYT